MTLDTKFKQEDNTSYSSGVLNVETRFIAFDHCSMKNGLEYIRIKDRDLAYATHPIIKEIVYVPLIDPNIGFFIFKKTPEVDTSNIKAFNDFARDIIDVSSSNLTYLEHGNLRQAHWERLYPLLQTPKPESEGRLLKRILHFSRQICSGRLYLF